MEVEEENVRGERESEGKRTGGRKVGLAFDLAV